ncbi:MAG TPA: hypothetical protein VFK10_08785, partial [Burkholderiaceae bacterium]|nr:hypothetical protein [Burkholderiaceae bacterium]
MPRIRPTRLVTALAIAAATNAFSQTTTEAELARKIDQLAAELAAVKAQLAALQQQRAAQASAPAAAASAPSAAAPAAAAAADTAPAAGPSTVFSGYAELNYNRPTRQPENTQADLRRFVLGVAHRFSPTTKMVSELEVEHAVSSAGDPGEVALEQAYVEH